jgi:hypothetical protein
MRITEVDRGIAGIIGRVARRGVTQARAFETRPGLEAASHRRLKCSSHSTPRLPDDGIEERRGDIALKQAVRVLGEGGRSQTSIFMLYPTKSSQQDVVVEHFDEQPLAAHGV